MDPEEWEKHYLEFEKRMAKIDAIYKYKIHLIARQRKVATFFLTGYVVLLFSGIIFMNYVVMIVGMLCAAAVLASIFWCTYQLNRNPYPGPGDE